MKLAGHADIIELESLVHSFQGQDEESYSPFVTASMDSHPRQAWLGADDFLHKCADWSCPRTFVAVRQLIRIEGQVARVM